MGPRRLVQGTFSVIYLMLIILTIPLAFDVGGEDCGLAFTFTLSMFYLVMSTIRILTRRTRLSVIGSMLYYTQHIITPSLLILHLGLFSETPLWLSAIQPWKWMIKNATPLFTCLEGFCTLLVIQATGHVMRWLNNKRSDSWMLVQILVSGCVLTISLYFLYCIYTFPMVIDMANATLIGAVLTITTLLGFYGIVSQRGSAIESSLLSAYVVYCLYITFTDFQTTITIMSLFPSQDIPPIFYTNMATVAELVPQGFITVFDFFKGACATITPSVVISLSYRLAVFYAATRIIPALGEPSPLKKRSKSRAAMFIIYAYAPCLIIAVYTNLLMQHFGILKSQEPEWFSSWTSLELWQLWGWINMFSTLALYSLELIYGKESSGEALVENHFKQD